VVPGKEEIHNQCDDTVKYHECYKTELYHFSFNEFHMGLWTPPVRNKWKTDVSPLFSLSFNQLNGYFFSFLLRWLYSSVVTLSEMFYLFNIYVILKQYRKMMHYRTNFYIGGKETETII